MKIAVLKEGADGERLTDDVSKLAYLRTVQDWVIRPQLRTVEGVAGVSTASTPCAWQPPWPCSLPMAWCCTS